MRTGRRLPDRVGAFLFLAAVCATCLVRITPAAALSWTTGAVDTLGWVGEEPSLVVDRFGTPHISYFHQSDGDLRYATLVGASWSVEVVDDPAQAAEWYSSIAVDSAGKIHIVYYYQGSTSLAYAVGSPAAWTYETVEGALANAGTYCSLALDTIGHPHISYFHESETKLRYATWTGVTWNFQFLDEEDFSGYFTSIALDDEQEFHVSYYLESYGDLRYAHSTGEEWTIEEVDTEGNVGAHTSIAIGPDGVPHIAYYDYENEDLKYAVRYGGAWVAESPDTAGLVGGWPSIAVDRDGVPHISYFDESNGDLRYATQVGGEWKPETVDSANYVGMQSSLALDGEGNVHIAYLDNTNHNLLYAVGAEPPVCSLSTDLLDFGSVTVGSYLDRTLTLWNTGGGEVYGAEVLVDCAGFELLTGQDAFTLTAGESLEIVVRFEPEEEGPYSCAVELSSGECEDVECSGTGLLPVCVLSPDTLDFGAVALGESADAIFTVTNDGTGVLTGTWNAGCGSFTLIGDPSLEIAAGETDSFTVRFRPANEGAHRCSLSQMTGNVLCSDLVCAGEGTDEPVCVVTPGAIDFGDVHAGAWKDTSFTIENDGGGLLEGSVDDRCGDFEVRTDGLFYSLESGESKTFSLRFAPPGEGSYACTLGTGLSCADLVLSGRGETDPVCVVEPSTISFGGVLVSEVSDTTVVIRNEGGGTLEGVADSSCGAFFITDDNRAYSLSAGESRSVGIRFAPAETGGQSCALFLGVPCDSLTLGGTGLGGALCGVGPGEIDFGSVFAGESAESTFTITNNGDTPLEGEVAAGCGIFQVVEADRTYSLGSSETATFTVRFEPTGGGVHACTLATGASCTGVFLTGVGTVCVLTPTEPAAGAEWVEGETRTIEWSSSGCSESVRIDLFSSDTLCAAIADSTANDGTYPWVVRHCGGEDEHSIRIADRGDTLQSAFSEGFTILSAPALSYFPDSIGFLYDPLHTAEDSIIPPEEIVITNTGGSTLEVSFESGVSYVTFEPDSMELAPLENDTLFVSISPEGYPAGLYSSALAFFTNMPSDPVQAMNVHLTIRGYDRGDLNGSGELEGEDLVLLIDHILETTPLGAPVVRLRLADANRDSSVNVGDVVFLARAVARAALKQTTTPEGGSGSAVVRVVHSSAGEAGIFLRDAGSPRVAILRFHRDGSRGLLPNGAEPARPSGGALLEQEGEELLLLYYDLARPEEGGRSDEEPLALLTWPEEEAAPLRLRWGELFFDGGRTLVIGEDAYESERNVFARDDLAPCYPNPFSRETSIAYRLASPSPVRLAVFTVAGRMVRTVRAGDEGAGSHVATWDGRDEAGRDAAPGVYFVRLETARSSLIRRVVLLK